MNAWLKQVYRHTDWGFRLLFPLVRLRRFLAEGRWRSDRAFIERAFRLAFGSPLDWKNPRTLNEKLNWMKLHYRHPLQPIAADKFAVRSHVQSRAGGDCLIPLLDSFRRANDIRFESLPHAFVLKTNHGSGQNLIVRDKSQVDPRAVVRQFQEWMATGHYATSREWPYRGMTPRIVAEKLLLDESGEIPPDYKLHCFHGKACLVQVDIDRETRHRRNFYDLEWNLQPFIWTEWRGADPLWPNGRDIPRPEALPEMVRLAETLAADFPYARIDLFLCRNHVYFGEITFYHGGALERFFPAETDLALGELLRL